MNPSRKVTCFAIPFLAWSRRGSEGSGMRSATKTPYCRRHHFFHRSSRIVCASGSIPSPPSKLCALFLLAGLNSNSTRHGSFTFVRRHSRGWKIYGKKCGRSTRRMVRITVRWGTAICQRSGSGPQLHPKMIRTMKHPQERGGVRGWQRSNDTEYGS